SALCVHTLFEAEAERAPDTLAVVFEDRRLTYGELHARANQLAHRLRPHGVGPRVPGALNVDRSLEMLVGLLGVLKAGGAYVPIDPNHPDDRRAALVEDSGAPVLVTTERLRTGPLPERLRLVSLDGDAGSLAEEPVTTPAAGADPRSLAYVIYTSGSTGGPKGAVVRPR